MAAFRTFGTLLVFLAIGVMGLSRPYPTLSPIRLGTPIKLTSITMISTEEGWALSPTAVVRTNDGGRTWLKANPSGLHLKEGSVATSFISASDAVAMQENTAGTVLNIFRTRDKDPR